MIWFVLLGLFAGYLVLSYVAVKRRQKSLAASAVTEATIDSEGSPHLGDLDPDSHRTRFIVPKARKSVYRLQRADHTSTPPQRLTSVASARFTTPIVCAVELIFVRHGLPLHVVKDDGSPADP